VINANPTNKVEGVVLDKNDNALYSILVRAYRNGKKLPDEDRTKRNGEYLIKFDSGSPITLRYDHTDYHPSRVENICGSRDHNIGKALFSIDEELSSDQKLNLISTLTQIYSIDKAIGVSDEKFISRYGKSIRMAKFPIDMLVMLPFNTHEIPNLLMSEENKSIFDVIASIGSFNTFIDLVKAGNYEDVLKREDPITVFAPTDKAFRELPEGYIDYLKKPSNKNLLESALKNWTIQGAFDYAKVKEFGLEKKHCGLEIIYPDIKAKNGIIHAVDKVELP
jgi:hypothetical protein